MVWGASIQKVLVITSCKIGASLQGGNLKTIYCFQQDVKLKVHIVSKKGEIMTGNKKLMIALFSICLVVIAGLLTTVIVLATQSGTITSSINISYTATDIQGTASATYTVKNGSPVNLVAKDGSATTITFNAADETLTNSLSIPSGSPVNLTSANDSVTFTYTFTNTGAAAYNATVNYTGTDATNFTVQYSTDNSDYQTLVQSEGQTVAVAAGSSEVPTTVTFYIRITLADVAQNANFVGSFAWTLQGQAD